MEKITVTETWLIEGMTCINCENKIKRILTKSNGISEADVSYANGSMNITYDKDEIKLENIIQMIEDMDYHVIRDPILIRKKAEKKEKNYLKVIGVIVVLLAIYVMVQAVGASGFLQRFPMAEEGMGYGMLFVIGLLTSVHCVGMCGGICLTQCMSNRKGRSDEGNKLTAIKPSLLYNLGRVFSYTIIGGIVGGLGSVVSFTGGMKGIVQILAGIFMIIMGLNMMNVFPALRRLMPRLPKSITMQVHSSSNQSGPFYVGLVNGFMPCGPLQAMQLYALSTGNLVEGALSMLLFSLGTVPLMFGLGTLSALLSKKFTKRIMSVGAAFVVVLGIVMFQNGTTLSGVPMPSFLSQVRNGKDTSVAVMKDGIQEVVTTLESGRYEAITVKKGVPTRWIIQATNESLNGCNDMIIVPKYNTEKVLIAGDNIIEFMPTESGVVSYSCWMGMIYSTITVVD